MKTSQIKLHPRSKHHGLYDFNTLKSYVEELQQFIIHAPSGNLSIDFSNPKAVKCLNKAILAKDYNVKDWDIPNNNLCPAIPGRADYIHYLADLLSVRSSSENNSNPVNIVDIGTGASLIYPLIGVNEYQWSFTASDINVKSLDNAKRILHCNDLLDDKITLILQTNQNAILKGVISTNKYYEAVMCNPPFFKSLEDYQQQNARKNKNLTGNKNSSVRNFSGNDNELYCSGGEKRFIEDYIYESRNFSKNVGWFTCLVSNKDNLKALKSLLKRLKATDHKIIEMQQGNKISRVLAWKF